MSMTLLARAAVALQTLDMPEAKRFVHALREREITWKKLRRAPQIGPYWVDVIVYQYRLAEEDGEGWGVATVYFDAINCIFYQHKQGLKITWEKGIL